MKNNIAVIGLLLCLTAGAFVSSECAGERSEVQPVRIYFKKGASSAILKGRITGYGVKDYVLHANAGQTLTIMLKSPNIYTYFGVQLLDGSPLNIREVTEWTQVLPETGDYLIRVLMMRAGARKKGSFAEYTLDVSIK